MICTLKCANSIRKCVRLRWKFPFELCNVCVSNIFRQFRMSEKMETHLHRSTIFPIFSGWPLTVCLRCINFRWNFLCAYRESSYINFDYFHSIIILSTALFMHSLFASRLVERIAESATIDALHVKLIANLCGKRTPNAIRIDAINKNMQPKKGGRSMQTDSSSRTQCACTTFRLQCFSCNNFYWTNSIFDSQIFFPHECKSF